MTGKNSLIKSLPTQLPSPPPEGEEPTESNQTSSLERQKWRDEVLLDFALLEASLKRIQLVLNSNARERERYAAEKEKILETAQAVRDNTVELREQLAEAQRQLELRKGYDELASKILDDKKLKSRDECSGEIQALQNEIEGLEQEGRDVEVSWSERREQFERVRGEGMAMLRLIRGEKEVEEAKEEGVEETEDGGASARNTQGGMSRMGTPGHEGATPRRETEGATPSHENEKTVAKNRLLDVEDVSRLGSRAVSPARLATDAQQDVEMGEGDLESTQTTSQPAIEISQDADANSGVMPAISSEEAAVPEAVDAAAEAMDES